MFRPTIALLALLLLATACGGGTTPSGAASAADPTQTSAASSDTQPSEVAEATPEPSAEIADACDLVPDELAGFTPIENEQNGVVNTPETLEEEAAEADAGTASILTSRAAFWNAMGVVENCQEGFETDDAAVIVIATTFMNEQGRTQYYANEWGEGSGCQPLDAEFPAAPDATLYTCVGGRPAAYVAAVVPDGTTTGWEIISRADYSSTTVTDEVTAAALEDAVAQAGAVVAELPGFDG
jgi:hypothetical protein